MNDTTKQSAMLAVKVVAATIILNDVRKRTTRKLRSRKAAKSVA